MHEEIENEKINEEIYYIDESIPILWKVELWCITLPNCSIKLEKFRKINEHLYFVNENRIIDIEIINITNNNNNPYLVIFLLNDQILIYQKLNDQILIYQMIIQNV